MLVYGVLREVFLKKDLPLEGALRFFREHFQEQGYAPTIVEKYPTLRKGGYKVDVQGTALEVAKRMGIYQSLIDSNVNLKQSKFVTPDLKILEFKSEKNRLSRENLKEIFELDFVHFSDRVLQYLDLQSFVNCEGRLNKPLS